jgi:hypothetical protein
MLPDLSRGLIETLVANPVGTPQGELPLEPAVGLPA